MMPRSADAKEMDAMTNIDATARSMLIARALEQVRVAIALPEEQHDTAWETYWGTCDALRYPANLEAWQAIAALATSDDSAARSLVPNVLRYFGGRLPERPLIQETVDLLRAMLVAERDPEVIGDIGRAFIDLRRDNEARALMLPYRRHESGAVRIAVVHALGLSSDHPESVAALIELSRDREDSIRNWATFFIGDGDDEAPGFDLPAIREALAARIDDPHSETRAEAIAGLARRKDKRAFPALIRELEAGCEWGHCIEASFYLASPELVPVLERVQRDDEEGLWEHGVRIPLSEVLAACRAAKPAP